MIFASDSPAKEVVIRMLLRKVPPTYDEAELPHSHQGIEGTGLLGWRWRNESA